MSGRNHTERIESFKDKLNGMDAVLSVEQEDDRVLVTFDQIIPHMAAEAAFDDDMVYADSVGRNSELFHKEKTELVHTVSFVPVERMEANVSIAKETQEELGDVMNEVF